MHIQPQDGIKPISDFRKESSRIIRDLKKNREPILLTHRGRSVAVLLDVQTFEEMDRAAQLRASFLKGIEDVKKGRTHSHKEVQKLVRNRFKRAA